MNAMQKRATRSSLVLALGLGMLGSAHAASEDGAGWITVRAPKVVQETVGSRAGLTDSVVSLTHKVSSAGLDLAMHSDVRELYRRIGESVQTACAQLEALYPLAELDTQTCEREALQDAWSQAQTLVDAAIRGPSS